MLPWKQVTIIPTDDRLVVAVDDERSKIRAIAKTFLPLGARVVPDHQRRRRDYKLAGNAADARLQDLAVAARPGLARHGRRRPHRLDFAGPDLQAALDAPKARRAVGVMPDPLPEEATGMRA